MTVKELRNILNQLDPSCDSLSVDVPLKGESSIIGAIPSSSVCSAEIGIDWDTGKYFLETEHRLKMAN